MKDSKIGWCDDSCNLWWGCSAVAPECVNCYAEELDARYKMGGETHWGNKANRWVREYDKWIGELRTSNNRAAKEERPRRIFVNSMSDLFEDRDELDFPRNEFFNQVTQFANLRFLLLTKRPENVMKMIPDHWNTIWPSNVAIGTTVGHSSSIHRAQTLLTSGIPAPCLFLSMEPLLEDITEVIYDFIHGEAKGHWERLWWLVGGESGKQKARVFDVAWAENLLDIAEACDIPFFMKQLGSNWIEDGYQNGRTQKKYDHIDDFPKELQVQQYHHAVK